MIVIIIDRDTMSSTCLRLLEEYLKLDKDPYYHEKLPKTRMTFCIIKEMDLVPSHLRDRLGIGKLHLSYVIRENVQPATAKVQVSNRVNRASCATIMEELIP